MYNPFNIPEEFMFEQKQKSSSPIVVLNLTDLLEDTNAFKTLVNSYEPVQRNSNGPMNLSLHKQEIMSQTNIHQKLIEHIIPAINEQWIVNGELSVSDYGFFVYGEGSAFPLHIDNGSTDRILVAIWAPHRKFSALFYLDDYGVDYTGGEFVIHPEMGGPIKSIEIHPTKCMMIIFPSNLYFTHEVKKIKSGRRIMFSTFLDVTPK